MLIEIIITLMILIMFYMLWRIISAQTISGRITAYYFLGILSVIMCVFLAAVSWNIFLLLVALAWFLQVYFSAFIFKKYLEGKDLDV